MSYSLAIFDLDGTLADSFPWFLAHLDAVADRFGFRRVGAGEVESLRHAGTREILRRLEVPLWKLPAIGRYMRALKAEQIAAIPLFRGVPDMLRALNHGGVRLALVSSDHEANVRAQLGPANAALFADFACGAAIFGKAQKFRRVVRRAGIDPSRVLAIGDETRDIEAARSAGIACAAVTWGYAAEAALRAHGPDMVFARMEEIASALLSER
jgi:phosphoglycolate phosphatase